MNATSRHSAVRAISDESIEAIETNPNSRRRLPELFGANVFNDAVQRQRLARPVYEALRRTIDVGEELDASIADAVANAMKDWAIERGATHYTHWFQPMTGLTAEKHDSFIRQMPDGHAILEFSGKELIKGEPDASSFPSGGIRATFEARGYTAWDPTSPAFLRETPHGATLTIPTAFCSWTGEALDKKTPLLRSVEAIGKQAVRILHLIGEENVTKVYPTCGGEQEYFLIDRSFFHLRPDLVAAGRTLFGAPPPKGQELEDHYFGAISRRVLAFMMELEHELWKLGVPIKTRHNEVAPAQFELAPIFEHVVVATDHNMLTMEVAKELAERKGLHCLLNEKPFAGVNGSGKHLNWSLADNLGNNLLDPGSTPHDNLKFVLFLTAILKAVDTHQDLLLASVASAGNDHRLGANEAPPAILSVFVGQELETILEALIEGRAPAATASGELRLGVSVLPPLPRDISDRNRTSPFAFTGNKFEFRAGGAAQSLAYPNTIINTIVAEALDELATRIESTNGSTDRRAAIHEIVREALGAHRRILFSGDNYADDWVAEAERRGLENLKDTPAVLERFAAPKNAELFERYGVLTERETTSRIKVLNIKYAHQLAVEARSMIEIAATMILPAATRWQRALADTVNAVKEAAGGDAQAQRSRLADTTAMITRLVLATDALGDALEAAEKTAGSANDVARAFRDGVFTAMAELRAAGDELEVTVEDQLWPLPKYREILFLQ